MLKIGIYNEAGELVRVLLNEPANGYVKNIDFTVNSKTSTALLAGQKLDIYMGGVEILSSIGQGGTMVVWDGVNNRGQKVETGVYYLKIEQSDQYAHTNVTIRSLTVIKAEAYVELRVYNSAGELVRTIREDKSTVTDKLVLNVAATLATNQEVLIGYSKDPADVIKWDGKNDQGVAVSSGSYEIQIVAQSLGGSATAASKTVVVLNRSNEFLTDEKIYPNPYDQYAGGEMFVTWNASGETGKMRVVFYNLNGEKVRGIDAALSAGMVSWDMKTDNGSKVASGFYVCMLEGRTEEGYLQRKFVKAAVSYKAK